MGPLGCFKERIPGLETKIGNKPSFFSRSEFTVYAFGRATFIELAVCNSLTCQSKGALTRRDTLHSIALASGV